MAKKKIKFYTPQKKEIPVETMTFRDLYFATVDKLYENSYTRVLNHEDTLSILIDTYLVMYDDIKTLGKSPSLMWWLRKCNNEGYLRAIRSKNISFLSEQSETEDYPTLSEEQKYDLWHRILKIRDINEYTIIPVPAGEAHDKGGMLGPLKTKLKSTSMIERILLAGIILGVILGCVVISVAAYKIIPYFIDGEKIEAQQEIFLPESAYEGINVDFQESVINESKVSQAVAGAKEKADYLYSLESHVITTTTKYFDPEWASTPDYGSTPDVASMETVGKIDGKAKLTGDDAFDSELVKTMEYLLNERMSDRDRIATIYSFVCHYGSYKQDDKQSANAVAQAKSFFRDSGGDSIGYASAFKVLCNAAGYDCNIINGEFILQNSDGTPKYVEHTWAAVILNGIEYHCDPEADCSADGKTIRSYYMLAARGTPRWEVFSRDHRWRS